MSSISAGTTSTTTLVHSGDTTGSLVFKTNDTGSGGTTAVTIDTSQNVTCVGNITLNNGAADGAQLTLASSGYSNWNIDNYSGALRAYYNATEYWRISSTGNMGIGTTSPTSPLQVNTAGVNTTVQINSTDANGGYGAVLALNNTGTGGRQYAIYSTSNADGDVGGGKFKFYDVTASTTRMLIDSSGYLNCPGVYNQTNPNAANVFVGTTGNLYRSTSSLKYKTNIKNSTHGLVDLLKLRSVTYQSNNPDNGNQIFGGLIAEEVHDAGLTEFVQYADDGTPDALAYGNMVSLCIKAIQELKAINDQQAETINALTARVVALESK